MLPVWPPNAGGLEVRPLVVVRQGRCQIVGNRWPKLAAPRYTVCSAKAPNTARERVRSPGRAILNNWFSMQVETPRCLNCLALGSFCELVCGHNKRKDSVLLMKKMCRVIVPLLSSALMILMAGCQSASTSNSDTSAQSAASAQPTPAAKPAAKVIRIKAGSTDAFKDAEGNVWEADHNFEGGDTIARDPAMAIANTTDPGLYRSERYGMTGFSMPLPNGKYTVKLHFAETFEGVEGPGQRVFSFNVQGQDFKDFDVFVKAGGLRPRPTNRCR